MKIAVLGYKAYDFTDEKTGRRVSGITMHYVDPAQDANNQNGYLPCKFSVPERLRSNLKNAPAIYDAEFTTKPASGGRPVVVLSKLTYMNDIKVFG